jgi:long-subunit fatty acid transport protein
MRKISLFLILVLSINGIAFGYSLNLTSFGVRSVAMGGTSVASSNDASALYNNPALLAKVRKITFNGSFLAGADKVDSSTIYNDVYSEPYVVKNEGYGKTFLSLDMVGFVFPSMQSKVDNSYGLTIRTEYPTTARDLESSLFVGGIECLSFGSGIQLIENLLVGYSLNLRIGSEQHSHDKLTHKGINGGVGLAIVFPESPVFVPTTVGITYSMPYEMEFEYTNSYRTIGFDVIDGIASCSGNNPMDIPSQLGFGAAWELKNLLFTIDAKRFGYSELDNYTKDVYHIMSGVEHKKELKESTLHTRAGYAYKDVDQSMYERLHTYANVFSVGCGLEHNLITYEIAFSYNNMTSDDYRTDYYTSKKNPGEFRILMGLKIVGK